MPGIENTGKASLVILVRSMDNLDSVSGPDHLPRLHWISQCALVRGLPRELPPGVVGCLQRQRVIDADDREIARNLRAVITPGVVDLAHMNRPGPGHFLLILGVDDLARMPGFPDHCPVIIFSDQRNRPVVLGKQSIDLGKQIQSTVSGLHRVNAARRGKAGVAFRIGPGAHGKVCAQILPVLVVGSGRGVTPVIGLRNASCEGAIIDALPFNDSGVNQPLAGHFIEVFRIGKRAFVPDQAQHFPILCVARSRERPIVGDRVSRLLSDVKLAPA